MKRYIQDIKQKTRDMSHHERLEYFVSYYWYHALIIFGIALLILFFVIPLREREKRPVFTCVRVNQKMDGVLDQKLAETFAKQAGLDSNRVVIDSDYNFSYGDVVLTGVNESSYEKFFLKWRNQELDGIIMPESCYAFCKEMGATYRNLREMETGSLPLYEDQGQVTAVRLEDTSWNRSLEDFEDELLLLVFPTEGKHPQECQNFLSYLESDRGLDVCQDGAP